MVSKSTVALSLSVVWSESVVTCMSKKPSSRPNISSFCPPYPEWVRHVASGTPEIYLVSLLPRGILDPRGRGVLCDAVLGTVGVRGLRRWFPIRGRDENRVGRWFLRRRDLFSHPLLCHLMDDIAAAGNDRALDDL